MGSWASYFGPQLLHLLFVCHSALVLAVVAIRIQFKCNPKFRRLILIPSSFCNQSLALKYLIVLR